MGLPDLMPALRREVLVDMSERRFERARGHRPALARHESVLSVLAALHETSASRLPEQEALIRALVAEQQAHSHPFWATVLLVAFHPMLCRLRGRLVGEAAVAEDLDQQLVVAFLEAVAECPLGYQRHTLLLLRRLTQRRVFAWLAGERREQARARVVDPPRLLLLLEHQQVDLDPLHGGSAAEPCMAELPGGAEGTGLAAALAEQLGGRFETAWLELVVATLVQGERLRDLAARLYPDLPPAEQERTYARLKRRYSRTLATLRRLLSGLEGDGAPVEAGGSAVRTMEDELAGSASHGA